MPRGHRRHGCRHRDRPTSNGPACAEAFVSGDRLLERAAGQGSAVDLDMQTWGDHVSNWQRPQLAKASS